jgi:DNA-binding response OmpR family regulator
VRDHPPSEVFPRFAVTGINMSATSLARIARVLVVDDNRDHKFLLTTHLERAGCTVSAVDSAELAIGVLDTFTPDIVIVDLMLPGISGRELVAWIKNPSRPQTIVVTTSVLDASRHPDANRTLIKPFSRGAVRQLLTDFAPRHPQSD